MTTRKPGARQALKPHITVRSELRALEVLEYFSRIDHAGTVTGITRALGYPQSSTSRLLTVLAEAGFLIHDRRRRTYRPTARVALLSVRTMSQLFGNRHLLDMLDALAAVSAGPVLLTARNDNKLNIIHVSPPAAAGQLCYDVGLTSPLIPSASGRVLLARFPDSFILSLLRRHNAETAHAGDRLDPALYLYEVEQIRVRGHIICAVEDAARVLLQRCSARRQGANEADCCLMQRGPHLVAPVPTEDGSDLAVIVSMPKDTQPESYESYVTRVKKVIGCYMTSAIADSVISGPP